MTFARTLAALASLGALWLATLALGAGKADGALLLELHADRDWLRTVAEVLTFLGNWETLVGAMIAGAAWLAWRQRFDAALLLLVSTMTGRVLIIAQKEWFARLRPDESLRLVEVHYKSFPSGHAGNSMLTYGLLAVLLSPPQHRRSAVLAAVLLSAAVGISRPVLGVHWPSDVIGGWAFGAFWLMLALRLAQTLKRNSSTSPSATT